MSKNVIIAENANESINEIINQLCDIELWWQTPENSSDKELLAIGDKLSSALSFLQLCGDMLDEYIEKHN